MLDKLRSDDFSPHIGKPCRLECGEVVIETMLDSVNENPQARMPQSAEGSRMPFTLIFRAEPDCPWSDGIFTLKLEGADEIPNVSVNRIMNIAAEPGSMFQAIFN